jgi:hypothetical protein
MQIKRTFTRLAAAAALVAAGAAQAAPTNFSVKAEDFFGGTGFGWFDIFGTQLDVEFALTNGGFQTFALEVGQSYSWTFGRVTLNETNIQQGETDNLGVTAEFDFNAPLNADRQVTTTAQAVQGTVNGDNAADFTIDWQPLVVAFAGGTFRISLNDLTFTQTGSQNQSATITLLSQTPSNPVPEPGSLALAAAALLGLGAASRRRRQG